MSRYDSNSGLFSVAEFKKRGVIKLAPDALVYISSSTGTSIIAPISGQNKKIDFNDGISAINVSNTIDAPGAGTATLEIVAPIYNSSYWIDFESSDGRKTKVPSFVPMMEIKIYFKGRFLKGPEPVYYPAFWGFITSVEENYSGGVYKLNLQCADMLHWWSFVQTNFKPGVAANAIKSLGGTGINIYGSRYADGNAFEIIYALTTQMGQENFVIPEYVGKPTPYDKILGSNVKNVWTDIMEYWTERFKNTGNLLRMYGATGHLINDPTQSKLKTPTNTDPKDYNKKNDGTVDRSKIASFQYMDNNNKFDVDDTWTQGFSVFYQFGDMKPSVQSEYLTKLDIATNVKNAVEYEFYQDVNGNFIFKPPFYNLDTRNILPYRISPTDIIGFSASVNSDEIITTLEVKSGLINQTQGVAETIGYFQDMDLTKRYGDRMQSINLQYLAESKLHDSVACGHLSKFNAKAFVASVTIPGRPELKLGYPVYIEHKDVFYYIKGINHSFDFGGSFTTSLSLEAERKRIYSREGDSWVVQKDLIFLLNPPSTITPITKTPASLHEDVLRGIDALKSQQVGKYSLVPRTKPEQVSVQNDSTPYTDEDGYRVVGAFRYGRGIILKAGTVLDQNTFTAPSGSSEDILLEKTVQAVTNGLPESAMEGINIDDYFTKSETANIETLIPEYMKSIVAVEGSEEQARALTGATSTKSGLGTVDQPLVNLKNTNTIKRSSGRHILTSEIITAVNKYAPNNPSVAPDLCMATIEQEGGFDVVKRGNPDGSDKAVPVGLNNMGIAGLGQMKLTTAQEVVKAMNTPGSPVHTGKKEVYDPEFYKNIDTSVKYTYAYLTMVNYKLGPKKNGVETPCNDSNLIFAGYNSGPKNVIEAGYAIPEFNNRKPGETKRNASGISVKGYVAEAQARRSHYTGTQSPSQPVGAFQSDMLRVLKP